MIFDIVMYAAAIVTVIAFVGSKPKASAPRQIVQDLEVLGAIAQALPAKEECFAVETTATVVKSVQSAVFDCGDRATEAEIALVEAFLSKPVDNVVPFIRPVKTVKAVSYRNRDELRAHCWSILGTAYDSVSGKRKFWTVARMVEELSLAGWEVNKAA